METVRIRARRGKRHREHHCNAWCRDGRHVEVIFTTIPTLEIARRELPSIWPKRLRVEVLAVDAATEPGPPPTGTGSTVGADGKEYKGVDYSTLDKPYLVWFRVDD